MKRVDVGEIRVLIGLLVLIICSGCGASPSVVPVEGTITWNGQPLAGAGITTQPIATTSMNPGSGSFGRTDPQGHYVLELVTPARKGAIVGEHRVMISPANESAPERKGPQTSSDGQYEFWVDDPRGQLRPQTQPGTRLERRWPSSFSDGSIRIHVPPEGTKSANLDLKQEK